MNSQSYRYEDEEIYDENQYQEDDFQQNLESEEPQEKKPRYAGTQLLLILQIVLCSAVLLFALAIKLLGGEFYTTVRDWYLTEVNRSVIASDQLEDYQSVWKSFLSPNQTQSEPSASQGDTTSSQLGVAMNVNQAAGTPQATLLTVPITLPLQSGEMTSGFGDRADPFTGEQDLHHGLDIGAPEGSAIASVLPGVVKEARENASYGKYILIDHGNGIQTRYAHCSELLVQEETAVDRGTEIAKVGMTGEATGNHLHLELIINGTCCNPQPLLNGTYM